MVDDMGIFKYYSPQDYNFMAFCKNQIFFSRPSNLNDPFDTSDLLIRPYKKFCEEVNLTNLNPLFESFGVCCFTKSEKADNRHLWALYANSYKGYALEFNEDSLNDSYYAPCHLLQVKYSNKPFNLNSENATFVDEHGKEHTIKECIDEYINKGDEIPLERLFTYLLHYKDLTIWQNESEYRIVMGKNKPVKCKIQELTNGFLMTVLPDAIKSITVGYNMSMDNKQMLKNCAKHKGIPIYEATPCIEKKKWAVRIEIFK